MDHFSGNRLGESVITDYFYSFSKAPRFIQVIDLIWESLQRTGVCTMKPGWVPGERTSMADLRWTIERENPRTIWRIEKMGRPTSDGQVIDISSGMRAAGCDGNKARNT
jgi:hypothetical protein